MREFDESLGTGSNLKLVVILEHTKKDLVIDFAQDLKKKIDLVYQLNISPKVSNLKIIPSIFLLGLLMFVASLLNRQFLKGGFVLLRVMVSKNYCFPLINISI